MPRATKRRPRSRRKKTRKNLRMRGGNPLKVAMFFVGRITAYQYVLNKLLDIKNKYNPVIFCSLNKEDGFINDIASFHKDLGIPAEQSNVEEVVFPEWVGSCLKGRPINPRAMYSMFYNMRKVFSLIDAYQTKNSMKFDCILYYRGDMDSTDSLELHKPEKNTIYLSNQDSMGGYNDRMAYGDYESMRAYCGLFDSLQEAFCGKVTYANPETLLKDHLTKKGLKINGISYNTNLHPKRK